MLCESLAPELNDGPHPTRARRAILIALSSDIGLALARHWLSRNWQVYGTYRSRSSALEALGGRIPLVQCDLADQGSIRTASRTLADLAHGWDVLVLCPGTLDPVGPFAETSFAAWEASLRINLTGPLQFLHELLPARSRQSEHGPCVIFFAGSGTNGTAENYSAYTVAKIALIKICELLDAEIPDTRFTILGTGPVKTKIHEATLRAGPQAGKNYHRVLDLYSGDGWTPMQRVLDCCDWVIRSPRAVVGGRNFSVVNDLWGDVALEERLIGEPGMYKLRRFGNDWRPVAEVKPSTEGRL